MAVAMYTCKAWHEKGMDIAIDTVWTKWGQNGASKSMQQGHNDQQRQVMANGKQHRRYVENIQKGKCYEDVLLLVTAMRSKGCNKPCNALRQSKNTSPTRGLYAPYAIPHIHKGDNRSRCYTSLYIAKCPNS